MEAASSSASRHCLEWRITIPQDHLSISPAISYQGGVFNLVLDDQCSSKKEYKVVLIGEKGMTSDKFHVTVLLENVVNVLHSAVISVTEVQEAPQTLCCIDPERTPKYFTANSDHGGYAVRLICLFHGASPIPAQDKKTKDISSLYDWEVQPALQTLSEDLSSLLMSKSFMDVWLIHGNRGIPAHGCLLAARSEYFASQIQKKMKDRRIISINITALEELAVDPFLEYVYTGNFLTSENILPSLYSAAVMYGMKGLRYLCRQRMINALSEDNCERILTVAELYDDSHLENRAIYFICKKQELKKLNWKIDLQ